MEKDRPPFEYKGFRYGISIIGQTVHFYTEKTIQQGKPQILLKDCKTIGQAHSAIKILIDKKTR